MRSSKLLAAAAISASLVGGGLAGAILGVPGLSGAQESTTTTTEDGGSGSGARFGGRGYEVLESAAEALGMSEEDLLAELRDGKSIADVAGERNVDVQTVIDALVASGTERLAEIEAALPERMSELVNRDGLPRKFGHHGRGVRLALDVAADALGVSEEDLRTALRDGKSIADVADEQNVDVQTVIDALVAASTERIDQAVEDGRIDEDEAAELKENLPERIADVVNREGGFGRFRHRFDPDD